MSTRGVAQSLIRKAAPAISLVVVALAFYVAYPDRPLTILDVRTILAQSVIVGLAALGMTIVIVSGGIDLSVGSGVALCGVIAAKAMQLESLPPALMPILAILVAAGAGMLCGVYNGALIVGLRLPPFIVTLGTLGLFRGVAKWLSGSSSVYGEPRWLQRVVQTEPQPAWLLVAPAVWVLVAIAALVGIGLSRTVRGRQVVAIGSNQEAARRSGVKIGRVKLSIYAACGLLTGLAGVVQYARLSGSGDPTGNIGLELNAVAAVVIGGASFSGGYASVFGTLCGTVLMMLLENRCAAAGWQTYVQELVVGHIIIAAVALDQWRRVRGSTQG